MPCGIPGFRGTQFEDHWSKSMQVVRMDGYTFPVERDSPIQQIFCVFRSINPGKIERLRYYCELQSVKNGSQQRENLVHLQFLFDKSENASQAAKIVNGVYGAGTVTANYVQFWFRRFRPDSFDVKNASHTGTPVVENVDKNHSNIRNLPAR
ncbi:histone-lysine N-methyltransferase SETMAR [Trichonephila clavipes]|nr:histone-lysine N-methyltransferase SETMAR [Trichonephila clavipes]